MSLCIKLRTTELIISREKINWGNKVTQKFRYISEEVKPQFKFTDSLNFAWKV